MKHRQLALVFGLVFTVLVLIESCSVRADTGTYTVTTQATALTVQTTGDVLIHYDIGMRVDSGSIPWVTIGLPTSNFDVQVWAGNVNAVTAANSGGWSGVRATLDTPYHAGESFLFSFDVVQREFVYKYNDQQASLSFTPNWWDNAYVENLSVTIYIPEGISQVVTTSQPTRFNGSSVVWEWSHVPPGTLESTGVLMPLSAFSHVGPGPGFSFNLPDVSQIIGYVLPIVIFVVVIGGMVVRGRRDPYQEPQVNYSGLRSLFRHINLDCPNDGSRLQRRTVSGVTIDVCDQCGGGFYDRGEIESLMEAGVEESSFSSTSTPTPFSATSTNVCPRCSGTLRKVSKSTGSKDVDIYACQTCGGVWLNKGMYQVIKEKRKEQQRLQEGELAALQGKTEAQKQKAVHEASWWWFYPYISYPGRYRPYYAPPVVHTCACVSCACVSSCACACACAGGGAAGCAPKTSLPQISFQRTR